VRQRRQWTQWTALKGQRCDFEFWNIAIAWCDMDNAAKPVEVLRMLKERRRGNSTVLFQFC